jgi:integrase
MRGCLQQAKTKPRPGAPKGFCTWNIILSLGRVNGRYRQKWVRFHGTRKQAELKLADLVGDVYRGEFVEPSRITLGTWLDEWLENSVKPRQTRNTHITYSSVVQKHIKPALGHLPLQQLTPLHLERYYAELTVAPRSIAVHHAVLTRALGAAVNGGMLRINVATRVENKPRVIKQEDDLMNVWTNDEARDFLTVLKQTASPQYAALFALALDAGLRKGELLGLQWKDLEGTTLRVERQLLCVREDEGKVHLDMSMPKGKRGRTLDLSEETVLLLREHKRQQAVLKLKNRLQYIDNGLVFAQEWEDQKSPQSALGLPLHRSSIGHQLDQLCEKSGVKRITVHGLRHTCATLLMLAGVPPVVVQKRLGHADAALTLNIYSHVLPNMQKDAAKRLATLLHG